MTALTTRNTALVAVAVALMASLTAGVWLMLNPTLLSRSTFAMLAAVVIAAMAIAFNTWRNAQAPTSTSEVIHEAEVSLRTRR
jgi:hypothetical protein